MAYYHQTCSTFLLSFFVFLDAANFLHKLPASVRKKPPIPWLIDSACIEMSACHIKPFSIQCSWFQITTKCDYCFDKKKCKWHRPIKHRPINWLIPEALLSLSYAVRWDWACTFLNWCWGGSPSVCFGDLAHIMIMTSHTLILWSKIHITPLPSGSALAYTMCPRKKLLNFCHGRHFKSML